MGIFPIVMNVLQFWLIDSIVKASSTVALPTDSNRNSFEDPAREPLFEAPSDNEDGIQVDDQPRYDIENPPPRSTSEEPRSILPKPRENPSTSVASEPRDISGIHSYPPSIASSSTTRSSSPPNTRPHRLHKQFKRRPPPPPLDLESPSHPAANIPAAVRQVEKHEPLAHDAEWDNSWGDSDDWASRVGDDDWAEQRIAEKLDVGNDQARIILPVMT